MRFFGTMNMGNSYIEGIEMADIYIFFLFFSLVILTFREPVLPTGLG